MPDAYHVRLYPAERTPGGVASGGQAWFPGAIAPHAQTQRFSYTVPTNRGAHVESVFVSIQRDTAAAPVNSAIVWLTSTAANPVMAAHLFDNTVGARDGHYGGDSGWLAPGDVVTAQSADASTGGTVRYHASVRYREIVL